MTQTPSGSTPSRAARHLAAVCDAQQALIDALSDGDPSRSASALAELRLALRARAADDERAAQALQAIDTLGGTLRHCHGIHEQPRAAA